MVSRSRSARTPGGTFGVWPNRFYTAEEMASSIEAGQWYCLSPHVAAIVGESTSRVFLLMEWNWGLDAVDPQTGRVVYNAGWMGDFRKVSPLEALALQVDD